MSPSLVDYCCVFFLFQLIDLALIVKRDAVGLSGDPLAKHMPSFCSSYEAFQDSAITNTVSGSNTATQMTGKGPGLVSPNQVSAPHLPKPVEC